MTHSQPPRVLAIIVSWNKKHYLERLLADLGKLDRPPDEIVVVDNASTDGTVEAVRRDFPHIHLIRNEKNLGGTGGFNCGMRWGLERGGFDYLWLLDNDVVVHERALTALLDVAESDERVGQVGSRIAELGRPNIAQEVGARVYWPTCTLIKLGMGQTYPEPGSGKPVVFDADYVASCSLLARVKAVEEVGIWDEGYFLFFDDIDWGVRFNRAGWNVKATSDSLVEHESFHERRLVQSMNAKHLSLRNALYFMHKLCPLPQRPFLLLRIFSHVMKDMLQYRTAGCRESSRCFGLALKDFFFSVRGKSAHVFQNDDLIRNAADGPPPFETVPARKKRILFWTVSASEENRRALDLLRETFPNHTIEVFVPSEVRERDNVKIEGAVHRRTRRPWNRLLLARWVLSGYDAVARNENATRLLFEHLLPVSVWYSEDGGIGVTRNSKWNALWIVLARPLIVLAALLLTAVALLKPRPRPDYFTWSRDPAPSPSVKR